MPWPNCKKGLGNVVQIYVQEQKEEFSEQVTISDTTMKTKLINTQLALGLTYSNTKVAVMFSVI